MPYKNDYKKIFIKKSIIKQCRIKKSLLKKLLLKKYYKNRVTKNIDPVFKSYFNADYKSYIIFVIKLHFNVCRPKNCKNSIFLTRIRQTFRYPIFRILSNCFHNFLHKSYPYSAQFGKQPTLFCINHTVQYVKNSLCTV